MFVIVMVRSNSTLRFVVVKKYILNIGFYAKSTIKTQNFSEFKNTYFLLYKSRKSNVDGRRRCHWAFHGWRWPDWAFPLVDGWRPFLLMFSSHPIFFGHVGHCKFFDHVQLLRFIVVNFFCSNSNQNSVIFIWSCELAFTISLLLIAFFIYNILVIMTWWCAMKNIILDIPFVVFTKMCLDGC